MIKAILLIFDPATTWQRIALDKKSFAHVFLLFFLPLVLFSVGGEVAGLIFFGKHHDIGGLAQYPWQKVSVYGSSLLVANFALVFIGTKAVKSMAETFHTRHTFEQCFTLVVYTLSPLLLVRVLNAYPNMNAWAVFAVGMALSLGVLYNGIPRLLQPDPPHAFGVFLMGSVTLTGIAALARYLTLQLLEGKIKIPGLEW